jgi:hypothetical protein
MRPDAYFQSEIVERLPKSLEDLLDELMDSELLGEWARLPAFFPKQGIMCSVSEEMGLGAGGAMHQEIFKDPHDFSVWDLSTSSRCFVHLCNSFAWRQITGSNPPHPPFTAKEYRKYGIPWFDYYRDDVSALPGSAILDKVKSVLAVGQAKEEKPLPDNVSLQPELIVQYGSTRRPDEVREFVEQ